MIYTSKPLNLFIIILFLAQASFAQKFVNQQEFVQPDPSDYNLNWFGTGGISLSKNHAIIGAEFEAFNEMGNDSLYRAGAAYIYEKNSSNEWIFVQKLVAPDRAEQDLFAQSVSISGNYAIVGAYVEDEDATGNNTIHSSGSAYIYERDGSGNWNFAQKIVASDRASSDQFGYSVCIQDSIAMVGAFLEDEDESGNNTINGSGSVYVFKRNAVGVWNQTQKIVASSRSDLDRFGVSLSINGAYVAIGASHVNTDASGGNNISDAGAVYIFQKDGLGNWNETQKIVSSNRKAQYYFGQTISLSNDRLAVGVYKEKEGPSGSPPILTNSGAAYIFERNGLGVWEEKNRILPSDRNAGDYFGYSIAIEGDHVLVGAYGEKKDEEGLNSMNFAGAVYKFDRNNSTGEWAEALKIVPNDRKADDFFGQTISLSDSNMFVFSRGESGTHIFPGSIYYYEYTCTSYDTIEDSACDAYTVPSGNATYTVSGTYNDTIPNSMDCDSIITINLTINQSTSNTIDVDACDSYTVPSGNKTYTMDGTYNDTIPNSMNCDSIITINLTINENSFDPNPDTITTCVDYMWPISGQTYNTSGNYTSSISNSQGCDSIFRLNLTIMEVNTSVTLTDSILTSENGNAEYQWIDCDNNNIAIPNATEQSYVATVTGNYAVIVTEDSCSDTSACIQVTINGSSTNIAELAISSHKVFPNPTSENLTIQLDQFYEQVTITTKSIKGKTISNESYHNTNRIELALKEPSGIYFIEILTNKNDKTLKVFKK